MTTQWAAVNTHCLEMRDPPQCRDPSNSNTTNHGNCLWPGGPLLEYPWSKPQNVQFSYSRNQNLTFSSSRNVRWCGYLSHSPDSAGCVPGHKSEDTVVSPNIIVRVVRVAEQVHILAGRAAAILLLYECAHNNMRKLSPLPYIYTTGGGKEALERLDSDQLHDFVKKTTLSSLKPLVLVFTEEHLSVEDFSWHDIEENTVFTQLQNVTSSADFINFFPSVHAPLKGFKNFVKDGFKQQGIHLGKQSIDSLKLSEKNGNVVIIKLDDAHQTEDRPDLLRRHDKIISDTYTHFVDKGFQVTALYTGRHTSWVEPEVLPPNRRIRRLLADEGEENTTTVWSTTPPTIILYSSSIPYITDAADGLGSIILNLTSYDSIIDDTGRNDTSRLILTFGGGIVLRFYFPVVGGYWSLPYVEMSNSTGTVEFLLNTTTDIVAPYNFSYHCAQEIIFSNTTMQRGVLEPECSYVKKRTRVSVNVDGKQSDRSGPVRRGTVTVQTYRVRWDRGVKYICPNKATIHNAHPPVLKFKT
uniref:V-type proton ATPase subunit S1 luminal domain-containing protein n=1 Tax=Timema poppense TaxID=170557 RepID=A0A7R9CYU7_TIMPO|nr:unnamed protein product [Timema poppensis]